MGLETSDSWAEFVGVQWLLDGTAKTLPEKLVEIAKVSSVDIQKLAQNLFVQKKMTIVAYGATTKKDVEKAINTVYCK
jgi:predicted Zn-dependent peptidase